MEGFPTRWTAEELTDFLKGAIQNNIVVIGITMLPPDAESATPRAKVRFHSDSDAKKAQRDLEDQKIAGKSLSIKMEGGNSGGKRGTDEVRLRINGFPVDWGAQDVVEFLKQHDHEALRVELGTADATTATVSAVAFFTSENEAKSAWWGLDGQTLGEVPLSFSTLGLTPL